MYFQIEWIWRSKENFVILCLFFLSFFQIHAQFPCSFEFTEKFLVTLADHAYFSNFGTFLCDSEYERNLLGVKENTVSLWSFLNRPEVLSKYLNCLYEPNGKVIWPSVAPVSLVILRIFWSTTTYLLSHTIRFCVFSTVDLQTSQNGWWITRFLGMYWNNNM